MSNLTTRTRWVLLPKEPARPYVPETQRARGLSPPSYAGAPQEEASSRIVEAQRFMLALP
jgi:hypothetical protein